MSTTPLLEIRNATRRFGGLLAVDDFSGVVQRGERVGLIGPNGAGKTTLFNLISGLYTPSGGSIRLHGSEISGMAPNQLAARGMSRTFQNLQVCMNLGALDNVMVGAHLKLDGGILSGLFRKPGLMRADRRTRARAADLLAFVGCDAYVRAEASAMPYGALKRLEIARALMNDPQILFLDEPAAGLNHTETHEIEELVATLAKSGLTVVLVEHDMKLVMNVSDRILVLDHGRRLAEGTPEEIRVNRDVIAAYLGTAAEEKTHG